MLYRLTPLALSFTLLSCFAPQKIIPLKGSYPPAPIQFTSSRSKDLVWSNLIDFFGQRGVGIKIIDRSSGLITCEPYQMAYTYENKNGIPIDPTAYLVIRKKVQPGNSMGGPGGGVIDPAYVIAEWNVIIKEQPGGTIINVNIVNPKYEDIFTGRLVPFDYSECRSTGVFEKGIAESIK